MSAGAPVLEIEEGLPSFDRRRLAAVTDLLERGAEKGVYTGAVALVARAGKVAYWQAVGKKENAPAPGVAMPRDAIFDLASLTKVVAGGTALLTLLEDGLATLDDPVSDHVPEFRGRDKELVRIRHIVTHTSGVQSNPKLYHEHRSWETLRAAYLALPLSAPPGRVRVYSSINFILLTLIVERLTGRPLDALVTERLVAPLGLSATAFNPPAEWRSRIPVTEFVPWRDAYDHGIVNDKTAQLMGGVSAHAGLFSTAWELAVFCRSLLNGGSYGGRRIFGRPAADLLLDRAPSDARYPEALCWWRGSSAVFGDLIGPYSLGHTGTTGTAMCVVPASDLTVVLLTNAINPTRDNPGIGSFRPRFFNAVAAAMTDG